jgi:hypothetical protein
MSDLDVLRKVVRLFPYIPEWPVTSGYGAQRGVHHFEKGTDDVRINRILLGGAVAITAVGLMSAPATAAVTDTADTVVTFLLEEGLLEISAPAAVTLGDPAGTGQPPGSLIEGQMGAVEVTDNRGAADATWTATVSSTDFCIGVCAADPSLTVPATDVLYWSGVELATPVGDGTFTEGQTDAGDAVAISTAPVAFSHDGGTGINSVSWNPTLEIQTAVTDQAGTYTGTVTHSVADA